MIREDTFWRRVAVVLVLLITLAVIANLIQPGTVPSQITLLLFGSLVALATGYSITNPESSPVRLEPLEEDRFRKRQYIIGLVFSILLALSLIVDEVRDSGLIWLFTPIMALPIILIVREWIKRGSA